MITPQLLSYIKIQLQKNVSPEEIKKTLIASGWQPADVEEGFSRINLPNMGSIVPSFSSQVTTSTASPKSNSNKLILVLIIITLALILIAGGVYAYFYLLSPNLTTDQIISKTLNNLSEIKSLEYEGELNASFNQEEIVVASQSLGQASSLLSTSSLPMASSSGQTGEIRISFSGASDLQTAGNPKGTFDLKISTSPFTSVSTSTGLSFGLELRNLGSTLFFKLNDVPDLGFFDLTSFKNQWVRLDPSSFKRTELGSSTEEMATQWNQAQIEQLKTILANRQIIKVQTALADEQINETDTYHYRLTLDKEALRQTISEISMAFQDKDLSDEEQQKVDQGLATMEVPNFEIWIGKKDFYPYKILLSSDLKNKDKSANLGQLTTTVMFKNFNQPVSVVAPDAAKTFQETMTEAVQIYASTSLPKTNK